MRRSTSPSVKKIAPERSRPTGPIVPTVDSPAGTPSAGAVTGGAGNGHRDLPVGGDHQNQALHVVSHCNATAAVDAEPADRPSSTSVGDASIGPTVGSTGVAPPPTTVVMNHRPETARTAAVPASAMRSRPEPSTARPVTGPSATSIATPSTSAPSAVAPLPATGTASAPSVAWRMPFRCHWPRSRLPTPSNASGPGVLPSPTAAPSRSSVPVGGSRCTPAGVDTTTSPSGATATPPGDPGPSFRCCDRPRALARARALEIVITAITPSPSRAIPATGADSVASASTVPPGVAAGWVSGTVVTVGCSGAVAARWRVSRPRVPTGSSLPACSLLAW